MVNYNNIAGISFIVLSFISAFFVQEELLISCGLAAIYCAIKDIKVKNEHIEVKE